MHNFALLRHILWKKLTFSYILRYFLFGIWIWFCAVENLGSSHHAFVVRALNYPWTIRFHTVFWLHNVRARWNNFSRSFLRSSNAWTVKIEEGIGLCLVVDPRVHYLNFDEFWQSKALHLCWFLAVGHLTRGLSPAEKKTLMLQAEQRTKRQLWQFWVK